MSHVAVAMPCRPNTSLVSIMGVNNEIGVVQPLAEIGEICRKHKVFFHSDVAQMTGKASGACVGLRAVFVYATVCCVCVTARLQLPLSVNDIKVDALSISGHKLYGPKGIGALAGLLHSRARVPSPYTRAPRCSLCSTGALYVRRRPRVRLEPQMSGGGQERGLRSGTLPHPLVVVRPIPCGMHCSYRAMLDDADG